MDLLGLWCGRACALSFSPPPTPPCHRSALSASQNTELRALLGQERNVSARHISTLQAQLSTSVSSMAAFNDSFNQLVARMAPLTAPEVVRLTCYGERRPVYSYQALHLAFPPRNQACCV